jgi:hypothetical protein
MFANFKTVCVSESLTIPFKDFNCGRIWNVSNKKRMIVFFNELLLKRIAVGETAIEKKHS